MTPSELYENAKYFFPPPPMPSAGMETAQNIPSASGVYFVWENKQVVYVGESVDLRRRLAAGHEHFKGDRKVSFVVCDTRQRRRLEAFYIGLLDPSLNKESTARCPAFTSRKQRRDTWSLRKLLRLIRKQPGCSHTDLHRAYGWRKSSAGLCNVLNRMVEWRFIRAEKIETSGRTRTVYYATTDAAIGSEDCYREAVA